MKQLSSLIVLCLLSLFAITAGFLAQQKSHERVRTAYKEKSALLTAKLKEHKLSLDNLNILITAYKYEQELEIYVKGKNEKKYRKLATYTICESSGTLGPKRKMGDNQVPEGFYNIDRFNPSSSYYLSLGLNYPNQSDKLKSMANNPGGDIFIHGQCVTIGCMPMTNDKIKEIYIYAIQAKHNGQEKIPVYVFPYRFSEQNINKFKGYYKSDKALLSFWDNLKTGYDQFHTSLQELKVAVDKQGNYVF